MKRKENNENLKKQKNYKISIHKVFLYKTNKSLLFALFIMHNKSQL